MDDKTKRSDYYVALEQYFNELSKIHLVEADNSDDEDLVTEENRYSFFPIMHHARSPNSSSMTIESTYHGKIIRFKGNQLIVWARSIMEQIVITPERDRKINNAVATRQATIHSPNDWLDYEGMFDAFLNMPAKSSKPFYGILTIALSPHENTTVSFRNKVEKRQQPSGKWEMKETSYLYAHVHDQILISFLVNTLGLYKYRYPDNYGMSYPNFIEVIKIVKTKFQQTDAEMAQRQLKVLQCAVESVVDFDRFLAYFNAVLFGSEASRNSLSFFTGILILNLIAEGKLTYEQSFQSPAFQSIEKNESVPYAVYPMASPYTGPKNMVAYNELVRLTKQEEKDRELSSCIGMKTSRERLQWSQIQLKEAILLKFWADDIDHQLKWLNATSAASNGHAVEFARQFNQRVVNLLNVHFPRVKRLFVYSQDELHALGSFKPSEKIWEEPDHLKSTITDFDALKWYLVSAEPLQLEKDMTVAMDDIKIEAESIVSSI